MKKNQRKHKKKGAPKKRSSNRLKVLWAVDPAPEVKSVHFNVSHILNGFRKSFSADIVPVTVMTERELEFSSQLASTPLGNYEQALMEMIDAAVEGSGVKGIEPAVVLSSRDSSRRKAVGELLKFAKKEKANLIVASSHSKKGIEKLFLGSFTEALCQSSKIPLLIIRPHMKLTPKIKHVLVATDFSLGSRRAFEKVVPVIKGLGAKVTILHELEYPLVPLSKQAKGQSKKTNQVFLKDFVEHQKRKYARHVVAWEGLLKDHKLQGQVVIEDRMQSVSQSVVDYAVKKKVDLIAMSTSTGPVSSWLLGSYSLQVLRISPCPVWVQHR